MGNENIISKYCGCKETEASDSSKKDKVIFNYIKLLYIFIDSKKRNDYEQCLIKHKRQFNPK